MTSFMISLLFLITNLINKMLKMHKKTRTGCAQCKRRRVKCDEHKPTCSGCKRNHLECSLDFLTPLNSACRANPDVQNHSRPLAPRPISVPLSDVHTNELMHHYHASIELSLHQERKRLVWCLEIPRMGLEYTFLLSGIRAVAALNLAILQPHRKQELQTYAAVSIGSALLSFREAMKAPLAQMVHASFVFAGSVIYYMMAFPEALNATRKVDRCRIPSRDDEHPHWFLMMRARTVLFANNRQDLTTGPLAALLESDHDSDSLTSNNAMEDKLIELEEICNVRPINSSTINPSTSLEEAREVDICKIAIQDLRNCSGMLLSKVSQASTRTLCDKTALNVWPGLISHAFLELIYNRNSRALVILAHYCVLLKKYDHVWCLTGLGSGLIRNIWNAVDEEWRPWMRWPVEHPCTAHYSPIPAGARASFTFA